MNWSTENTEFGGYDTPSSVPERARDQVVDRIEELYDRLQQNTEHALKAQMHEAYNRGYIDGIEWSFDQQNNQASDESNYDQDIRAQRFLSPTYNFGVMDSLDPDLGASMSPTYNFGSIGDGEDLPETEPVPDMGEPTVYNPQIAVSPGANVDINMPGTEGGTAEAGGSGLDGLWEPEFDIDLKTDSGGGPDVDASGGSGMSGAAS